MVATERKPGTVAVMGVTVCGHGRRGPVLGRGECGAKGKASNQMAIRRGSVHVGNGIF